MGTTGTKKYSQHFQYQNFNTFLACSQIAFQLMSLTAGFQVTHWQGIESKFSLTLPICEAERDPSQCYSLKLCFLIIKTFSSSQEPLYIFCGVHVFFWGFSSLSLEVSQSSSHCEHVYYTGYFNFFCRQFLVNVQLRTLKYY